MRSAAHAGEACDPARRTDGCELGLRFVRDRCVRPRGPAEARSLTDETTPCRDDSACASDVLADRCMP